MTLPFPKKNHVVFLNFVAFISKLIPILNRLYEMTNEWDTFKHLFKWQKFPARTILLQEDQISRIMFFIEKGCLRTWVK